MCVNVRANVETHGLLGKWREERDGFRESRGFWLKDHIHETTDAMRFLFEEPYYTDQHFPSFGNALFHLMHLHRHDCSFEQFRTWSFLSILAHDLGKCGGEFQRMLWELEVIYLTEPPKGPTPGCEDAKTMRKKMQGFPRYVQAYRHEFLSAILLYHHADIRGWFLNAAGSTRGFSHILASAFGHHLKAAADRAMRGERFVEAGFRPKPVYLERLGEDLRDVLEGFPLEGLPRFPSLPDWKANHPAIGTANNLDQSLKAMAIDHLFFHVEDNPVSGALKWLVMLADVYGSISNAPGEEASQTRSRIYEGLRAVFQRRHVDYEKRVKTHLNGRPKLPFQEKCCTTKNLIAVAGTGVGKTVGALQWASAMPAQRLLFCGHTTDATTSLFADYADLDLDALRHSRAILDLERLAVTPEDNARDSEEAEEEAEDCLEVLRNFGKEVTFTTADQVLGIMSFYRKSVMWLPHLLTCQIVFDEVHSYDDTMRTWHHRFLEWFPGLRTAHLSATLAESIQEDLASRLHRSNPRWPQSTGPRILHDSRRRGQPRTIPRYRIHLIKDIKEAHALFGPGAIWFLNTVRRCQETAIEEPEALVYHSRFRSMDRLRIKEALLAGFPNIQGSDRNRPSLSAIVSQAAEMCLNICAWVLLSEICPPAALIQRLGRLNRLLLTCRVADAYFYMPEADNGLPYDSSRTRWMASFLRWENWIRQFDGCVVSKDDLEDAFQAFYRDPANRPSTRDAHTDLLVTQRRSIRQSIVTIPTLLQSDVQQFPDMGILDMMRRTVPAILSGKDRKLLRDTKSLYRRMYVINDPYDARLGLLQKRK